MSTFDASGEFEKFVDSAEGREWLARHGWVRVSDVFERALVLPITSEDILEDALVMIIDQELTDGGIEDRRLHERGIMSKVGLMPE